MRVLSFVLLAVVYSKLRQHFEKFLPISDQEYDELKKVLVVKELKKKDFLIKEGEQEGSVYFVMEGLMHQYFFKGKEMISTGFMSAGDVTGGIVSFYGGKPSYYNVQALEPSKLIGLSRDNLEYFYTKDRKWQQLGRLMLIHYLLLQEKDIMDTIRLTMRERFVKFATEHPDLLERVPQRRIASYLNIKPETFSRLKPLLKIE